MRTREIKRIDPLQRLHLFGNVTAREFSSVRGLCFEMYFDGGEVIIEEGSDSYDAFVLTDGKVRVEKASGGGDSRQLAVLEPETVFGEISLVLQTPRTASVVAVGMAEVVRIDAQRFNELRRAGHSAVYKMAYNILEVLARRQSETNRHLLELSDRLDREEHNATQDDVTNLRNKLMKDWSF